MKLSLRQDWSPQPLSSFLFVLDLKTGALREFLVVRRAYSSFAGVQLALYFAVRPTTA